MSASAKPIIRTTGICVVEAGERTERRRAEMALREMQKRLQLATQASNIGLWEWNIQTNEVFFSPEWKRQFGYLENEISNRFSEWEDRLDPEDHDKTLAKTKALLTDPGAGYEAEFRLRHKDGSYRWITLGQNYFWMRRAS